MSLDTSLTGKLERLLDVASARQRVITNNMANIDTPGFRTQDIDFRSELRKAESTLTGDVDPSPHEVTGLIERPDGNNVDMDREGMALSETQLQFHAGIELLRSEFKKLSMAINDGRSA
jgi:flagellar basal-body rod protein FlgB